MQEQRNNQGRTKSKMRTIASNSPDFLVKLIKLAYRFKKDDSPAIFNSKVKPFTLDQFQEVYASIMGIYKKYPNTAILNKISPNFKDVLIVGDTHGESVSTLRIIQAFLDEKVESMIFLGDYITEGDPAEFTNLMLLFALTFVWPDRILMLRGNHEDIKLMLKQSLLKTLKKYFKKKDAVETVMNQIGKFYDQLPLVAITDNKSICMHGGLPIGVKKITIFDEIPKPHSGLSKISDKTKKKILTDAFMQVRWNDITEEKLKNRMEKSYHGYYFFTGKEIAAFLKLNKLKRIIRSHESARGTFQRLFDGKLLHVLSMESKATDNISMGYYYGNMDKGFVIHEEPDGTTLLRDLDFTLVSKIQ